MLTPIQSSVGKKEGYLYYKITERKKKRKSKLKLGDLVRNSDNFFSKSDARSWFYKS